MNNVIGPRVSTSYFNYDAASRTFIQEVSSLPERNYNGQVWNDSADAGFVLVSAKTNKEIVFTLHETDRNPEGDIVGWNYVSYRVDPPIHVLIIND